MINKDKRESVIERRYSKFLTDVTKSIIAKPMQTAAISIVVLIFAITGSTYVMVDNNNVKYFMEDSEISISANRLNNAASGSSVINYLVEIKKAYLIQPYFCHLL